MFHLLKAITLEKRLVRTVFRIGLSSLKGNAEILAHPVCAVSNSSYNDKGRETGGHWVTVPPPPTF